jgi:hypothetical protein
MKKTRNPPIAYTLAPGQSPEQYKALETKWYSKIRAKGFSDIEWLDKRGFPSRFSRDYSLTRLRQVYNEPTLEYFRRASIFLHDFTWGNKDLRGLSPTMGRYIWAHYCAGYTLREITKVLNGTKTSLIKGPIPSVRTVGGTKQRPPTLFWVHYTLKHKLFPTFLEWCEGPGAENIGTDWDMGD